MAKAGKKKNTTKKRAVKSTGKKVAASEKPVSRSQTSKKVVESTEPDRKNGRGEAASSEAAATKRTSKARIAAKGASANAPAGESGKAPSKGRGNGEADGRAGASKARLKRDRGKAQDGTPARNSRRPRRESGLPPATSVDPVQFPEETRKPVKSPLTKKQLREFKELLLERRAEIAGDVDFMASQFTGRRERGGGEQSSVPVHMADLGSDNWEQEFNLGLLANEHERLREIDQALARIENNTYGICLGTNQPIGLARLQAKPWAKYCIEYARAREEGRQP